MKKYLLLSAVMIISLLACNKTETQDNSVLNGNWRMVTVKDKRSFTTINNPGNQGEVIVRFQFINVTDGVLTGRTPFNDIGPDTFTVNSNHGFTLPSLFSTKVGETAWGKLFFDNILQTKQYTFKAHNQLTLKTSNNTELNFEWQ